jgi:hypothetical protein
MRVPTPTSNEGAIYRGLLVGVARGNRTVRPVSASWPDRRGRFRLVLPGSLRGTSVSLWMDDRLVFTRTRATPGGSVASGIFPSSLPAQAPQNLLRIRLPR